MARKKLGEIFVDKDIITIKTVDRILTRSKTLNKRFGTVLEDLGIVTGEELAEALAIQYNCKTVTGLSKLPISVELKELIPLEVAIQNALFPLKKENDKLALAMADPTDTKVVENIAVSRGLKIYPYISTREEIHNAICKHYIGKEPTRSSEKTVLIAEDDKMLINMFRDILKNKGYRVIVAVDGMDAFKQVIAEKPHVIVTDKEMPKLDGYGLLNAVRTSPETRQIPVILITGAAMSAEEEYKAFDKGFFDYILKPVKELTLLARVKRALWFHEQNYQIR